MGAFKRLNCKNHPSIAKKLVKFLAMNTSFESIEKVMTKTSCLDLEIVNFKKRLATLVKSAASAAKKADKAKKQSDLLSKQVLKLEEKVARLG
jgi:hypothetical protein